MFSTQTMIKPAYRKGTIPSSREAYGTLLALALPSVVEMVLSSLISSVDTMMVSAEGTAAIAAVGLSGQPRMLALTFVFGINVGVTAIVARRRGEERLEDAQATLRLGLLFVLLASALVTALCLIFIRPLMEFAGANEDTLELSITYFRIILYALPINALTLCINAAQRGVGNTKITMYVNVVSNVVNVIFNYLLIGGNFGFPHLGVAGAAIATDIGMGFGLVLALAMTLRRDGFFKFRYKKTDFTCAAEIARPIMKVSTSAMVEQMCIRIGFFLFAKMVASLGTEAYASHQICSQFLALSFSIADGLGVAGTSLVGYNLGRSRPDLSMMYGKVSQRVAIVAAVIVATLIALFKLPLIELFSDDPQVIGMSMEIMLIVALFQPFQMSSVIMMGCLRGAGDTKFVAVVMLFFVTIYRPAITALTLYVFDLGLMGAWLATLTDMIARQLLAYLRFASNKWAEITV